MNAPEARLELANGPIRWVTDPRDWPAIAEFFAATIAADRAYISHGEIQTGLSADGKTWAPDLARSFLAELGTPSDERSLAVCRDGADEIVAAANITWTHEPPGIPFATIQDMAVRPDLRSTGLGTRMFEFLLAEAKGRGMAWVFLESGKDNHRAHEFFIRNGMAEVSHVFGKRL